MRLPCNGNGYPFVKICTNGTYRLRTVHRLVAEAFLGACPDGKSEINHKNGVKADPRAANLEWCTRSENEQHAYDVLGHKAPRGEAQGHAKLTEADVRMVLMRLAAGEFQRVVAADYGVGQGTISRIANRKRWAWLT